MEVKGCLGVIIGHRSVFPGHLAERAREEIARVLREHGIEPLILPKSVTPYGAVSSLEDAVKYARFLGERGDDIDGILVSLPNFGDERAVAEAIRMSGLSVPVLVQAYPDELDKMDVRNRRDSFCGKLSVCNNLRQYGIPFSLTKLHTVSPTSEEFSKDLERFMAICRVVKGLKGARIGVIGARTSPFKTVRFNERLLEGHGISIETADLSEVIAAVEKLGDSDEAVRAKLEGLRSYCPAEGVPEGSLLNMAKLAVVLERWVEENGVSACALRCWPELQETLGIFPCAVMSMMSNSRIPFACETDAMGALSMYALQLAADKPAGLFDWNNNYGDDPDKAVLFHCSNIPGDMLEGFRMSYNFIDANARGTPEKSYGTCAGRVKPGPMTFLRISTDEAGGR
ncbi:fucose isomerase, partial [Candidatus Poribacteria bacterium]